MLLSWYVCVRSWGDNVLCVSLCLCICVSVYVCMFILLKPEFMKWYSIHGNKQMEIIFLWDHRLIIDTSEYKMS